jgi:PAS domain-containing protein
MRKYVYKTISLLIFIGVTSLLVFIYTYYTLNSRLNDSSGISDLFQYVECSKNLTVALDGMRVEQTKVVNLCSADSGGKDQTYWQFLKYAQDFSESLKLFENNVYKSEDGILAENIRREFSRFCVSFDHYFHAESSSSVYFFKNVFPIYSNLEKLVMKMMENSISSIASKKQLVNEDIGLAMRTFVVSVVFLIFFILSCAIYFWCAIYKPLLLKKRSTESKIDELIPKNSEEDNKQLDIFDKMEVLTSYFENFKQNNVAYIINEKKKMQGIVTGFCDAFILLNSEKVVLYANQPAYLLFEFPKDSIVGKKFSEVKSESVFFKKVSAAILTIIGEQKNKTNYHSVSDFIYRNYEYKMEISLTNASLDFASSNDQIYIIRFYRAYQNDAE